MIQQTDQIEDIIQMVQYSYSTTSIHQLYIVRFFSFVLFSEGLGGLTWSPLHHCCKTGRGLKYWGRAMDKQCYSLKPGSHYRILKMLRDSEIRLYHTHKGESSKIIFS